MPRSRISPMNVSSVNQCLSRWLPNALCRYFTFRRTGRLVERDEAVGRAEIAVEFRDLVFENPVIPKRVPGQVREQAVILMAVVPVVGQHQIGRRPSS